MVMKMFDDVAATLYVMIVSRGQLSVEKLQDAFNKLEEELGKSSTPFFLNSKNYSMVDIYGFPHTSRIFYMENSALDNLYNEFKFNEKYPKLKKWVYHMRTPKEFNDGKTVINIRVRRKLFGIGSMSYQLCLLERNLLCGCL
mmetsp:Transcript_31420/g.30767  ORF Transcript_31420/g.30767 Transcript_31420/m.30767 type:complete len:142 (+) Transcript_31420:378-803(+)